MTLDEFEARYAVKQMGEVDDFVYFRVAAINGGLCAAPSPHGRSFICTLPAGHPGPHWCGTSDGQETYAQWDRNPRA